MILVKWKKEFIIIIIIAIIHYNQKNLIDSIEQVIIIRIILIIQNSIIKVFIIQITNQ